MLEEGCGLVVSGHQRSHGAAGMKIFQNWFIVMLYHSVEMGEFYDM